MATAQITQMYQIWDSSLFYRVQVAYTLTVSGVTSPEVDLPDAFSNPTIPPNAITVINGVTSAIIADALSRSGVTITAGEITFPGVTVVL